MGSTDNPAEPPAALADDERFARWSTPRTWSGGSVSFGSVMEHLIEGLVDFAGQQPREDTFKRGTTPAVIGCVPWVNHERLTAALASMGACCIVMDKGAKDSGAASALHKNGRPIWAEHLPGFDEVGYIEPDGTRPMITPHGMQGRQVEALGPVRRAGYRGGKQLPLLHAKLLVLGESWWFDNDEEGPWGPQYGFRPQRAWHGSANWTSNAGSHLEFGNWIDDPDLVDHTFRFLLDVITFSEPFESTTARPQPELVDATWDDAAFQEYFDEYGYDEV
jgi:hypothetical protein